MGRASRILPTPITLTPFTNRTRLATKQATKKHAPAFQWAISHIAP
jgi:hypothetical protein